MGRKRQIEDRRAYQMARYRLKREQELEAIARLHAIQILDLLANTSKGEQEDALTGFIQSHFKVKHE